MSRKRTLAMIAIALAVTAGFVVFAALAYSVLVSGRTAGPDVLEAYRTQQLAPDAITSIEVVEKIPGIWPDSESDYAALPKRKVIDSPARIKRLMDLLTVSGGWRIPNQHPSTFHTAFVKVNTRNGYFWMYCYVLQDSESSVMCIEANNRNATNTNGATNHYLGEFSEVLAILEHRNDAEPGFEPSGKLRNRP